MTIPRQLHAIYVGSPIPDQHRRFLATWEEHHPDWPLSIWDDAALANFPLVNQAIYDEAEQIAPGSVGQLRSDVARYEILLKYGGIYVDTDVECLRSIEPLVAIAGNRAFAGWEAEGRWVNNAVLGAPAGHPFLRALVDGLAANVRRHMNPGTVRPNVLTGPQYVTPLYQIMPKLVHVFPRVTFYPFLWNELHRKREQFPDSYAVHWWANAHKRQGVTL